MVSVKSIYPSPSPAGFITDRSRAVVRVLFVLFCGGLVVARFEAFIVFCPVRCLIVVFSGSCLVAGCVFFFFFFFFFFF